MPEFNKDQYINDYIMNPKNHHSMKCFNCSEDKQNFYTKISEKIKNNEQIYGACSKCFNWDKLV